MEVGYATFLPLMLSDLLAAGAASDLATRLRKLAGIQIAADCAVQQLQALQQCTGLTHLEFRGKGLQHCSAEQGHPTAAELTAAFRGMSKLTVLCIQRWKLQFRGVEAALTPALWPLTQLQHLHIVDSRLEAAGVEALAPALSAMRGLQMLDLKHNSRKGVEWAQALCTLLGDVPGLKHLNVSSSGLGKEGAALLAPVLRGVTCLQRLNLSFTLLHDMGIAALAPALAALPCLHTLDVSDNELEASAVSALQPVLARKSSPLRKLDLSNQLKLEGAHALAARLSAATQLPGLRLYNTKLGDVGWVVLAPALSCLAASLRSLELGHDRVDDAGLAALAPALQKLTGLTCLKAKGFINLAAMVTISPALMGMRRLQVLDLHRTAMGVDGIAAFAAVLPALAGSLVHLDLSYCCIDAKTAAKALAPALAQATGPVKLRLGDTDFGQQAVQWLVPVLSALPHLPHQLDLYSCQLGLQGCIAVVQALKDRDGARVRAGSYGVSSVRYSELRQEMRWLIPGVPHRVRRSDRGLWWYTWAL